MIKIMPYNCAYIEAFCDYNSTIVLYGAGRVGNFVRKSGLLNRIDYFCDKNAKNINKLGNIKVIHPEKLENIKGNLYILICINDKIETMEIVKLELAKYIKDAKLYNVFYNISFPTTTLSFLKEINFEINKIKISKQIQVNLVCYEDPSAWILGKFARKLNESLIKMGVNSRISSKRDPESSINHHIIFMSYKDFNMNDNSIDTTMITHIDYQNNFNLMKEQSNFVDMEVCMSKETMDRLVNMGIPRKKLCYINPAHDGIIKPKKYILGITSKVHGDLRKNESMLVNICEKIDCKYFKFIIMGMGWDEIVDKMRVRGVEIEYYNEFDYDKYIHIMPEIDYYLYFGFDEGSMGFLDALAAGVETIVTPQGYHLDIPNAITYPCETERDFIKSLNQICEHRKERVEAVDEWTWDAYAKKHLDIWNYLLKNQTKSQLYCDAGKYKDGIYSVFFGSSYE